MRKQEDQPAKQDKKEKKARRQPPPLDGATVRLPIKEAVKEADEKAKAKERAREEAEHKKREEARRKPIFDLIALKRARATRFALPFPRELEKKMEECKSKGGVKRLWRNHVQKLAWEAILAGRPDPLPQGK